MHRKSASRVYTDAFSEEWKTGICQLFGTYVATRKKRQKVSIYTGKISAENAQQKCASVNETFGTDSLGNLALPLPPSDNGELVNAPNR